MSRSLHQMSNIVLPSKFHRPLLIDGVLMRNELHNRIDDGLEKRLTLVSAPAGFGKTTLVNSWLAANDCEVSWLSIDAHDNSCSRFLAYLESTICSSSQTLNECVLNRQNQIDNNGTSLVLKRIFQAFAEAEKFHVLVLDDYHLITNPEVHEAVNLILDNLKSYEMDTARQKGWHVFILSRSNPPFPIWRWRLNGEINEIGADDLRFSLEEAAVLLNRNLELGLSLEDVAEFNTRAEGWVAGLQLGAASMLAQKTKSNHKFISDLKGSYRLLSDYLIEEVFLQQTPAIQNFLLRTSILESMSSELCNAILETEDSHMILEYLERNNVFVVPLDYERHLYRYHNFFSDVLKNRLGVLPKEEINTLHSRAAVWLREHGFYEESVSHWLAAGQFDQAAQLIVDVASLFLNQGGFYTLGTLLGLFPDEEFSMRPWLSIYRAWTMYMLSPDETEIWLNRAEHDAKELGGQQKIEQTEFNAILGNIYAIRSLALVSADQEIIFSLASDALKHLPEEDENVRGLVYTAMGKVSLQINEKHNAIDYFRKGISVLSEGRNFGARADAFRYIGDTYKDLGKLHQALDAYREAISFDRYQTLGEPCYTNLAYLRLGEVLFEWNEVEDAFKNFERADQLSEWMGVIDQISCGIVIGSAWLDLGRIDKTENILCEYDDFIGKKSLYPQIDSELAAFKMNYLTSIGNYQEVDLLAKKRSISLEAMDTMLRESEFIAFSKSLYMCGNYKDALILSSNLEQSMAALGNTGKQIQLLALMAVCSYQLGEKVSAFNIAARVINMAESEGYIRTFVSYRDVMLEMLQKLSELALTNEYRINRTYLGYVISGFMNKYEGAGDLEETQFGLQYNDEVLPGVLVDTLSKREMDVLKLIASDQTNSEIADSLYISINTVKSHTSSIYNKLSVSNRLQAVNRARKLGLL